jgi:hypothetical protein
MSDYPIPTAVRHFWVEGEPGRTVTMKIGQPIAPQHPSGAWACPVLIEGIGDDEVKYAEGVDGIQALQSAMMHARNALMASGLPLTWLGQEPGDIGLPLPIQSIFGLWFERRLEAMVQDEERRVAEIQQELDKVRCVRRQPKMR